MICKKINWWQGCSAMHIRGINFLTLFLINVMANE
jgi:hypothetical protein